MKVPELRKLLEDFGEKNQEHYNRLHIPPRDRNTMDNSNAVGPSNPNDQPDVQNLQSQPRNDRVSVSGSNSGYASSVLSNPDDQLMMTHTEQSERRNDTTRVLGGCPVTEDEDAPITPTKDHPANAKISNVDEKEASMTVLSASSFDGSYGVIEKNRSSGEKTASTAVDSDVLLPGQYQSWDSDPPSVASWWSEEEFSEASFEPNNETSNNIAEGNLVSNNLTKTSSGGEFQGNLVTSFGIQGFEKNMGPDHVAMISRHTNPIPSADVNDASSLEESVGVEETSMHNASLFKNKILTSRTLDFLCDTKAASAFNPTASVASSADSIDSEGGNNTNPSISEAISEEVKSSKIGKLLLNLEEASEKMGELKLTDTEKDGYSVIRSEAVNKPPRRKLRNPEDLPFLHNNKNPQPLKGESPRVRSSSVRTKISQFGGAGRRKTLVERMTEELGLELPPKKAIYSKKGTWVLSNRTGKYERTTRIDVQYESRIA